VQILAGKGLTILAMIVSKVFPTPRLN